MKAWNWVYATHWPYYCRLLDMVNISITTVTVYLPENKTGHNRLLCQRCWLTSLAFMRKEWLKSDAAGGEGLKRKNLMSPQSSSDSLPLTLPLHLLHLSLSLSAGAHKSPQTSVFFSGQDWKHFICNLHRVLVSVCVCVCFHAARCVHHFKMDVFAQDCAKEKCLRTDCAWIQSPL